MKQNQWKIVKLGEVAEIVGGSTPKTNVPEYWDGEHYWITPAELKGERYISETERRITDKAIEKTNLNLLPVGTVLLTSRAPIGKVAIAKAPMYCNQGFKNIVCGELLNNEYVYYWLTYKKEYLNSLGRGATFKEISKTIVEGIALPLPPLSVQRSIVSELDLLSTIISKKKEQFKELDKLAQSTFYDMFGDPVTNEKGWEVKKLGEICELKAGGDKPKDFSFEKTEEYHFPICANGTENRGIVGYSKSASINYPCITISGRGTIGFTVIHSEPFTPIVRLIVAKPNNNVDLLYFKSFIDSLKITSTGNTIPQLTVPMVKNIFINIPPLSLQQTFASKIEAIETQKELIKTSVAEVQTLLDATMDKYFE